MWEPADTTDAGKTIAYEVGHLRIRCSARQEALVGILKYDPDGGILESSEFSPLVWHYYAIAPETEAEAVLTFVCSRASKRHEKRS